MKKDKYAIDVDSFPNELQLLLLFLKLDNFPKENEKMLEEHQHLFAAANWDHFIKLADHHHLYPVLYHKLKSVKEKWVPSIVVRALQMRYQNNTLKILYLCGEMDRVAKAFHEHNIRSLHLKGPILAHELYGDISMRKSKDLDILVPKEDLERTEQMLFELGYEKDEANTVLNEVKWREHHFEYHHKERKTSVEIHWRLSPFPAKEPSFEDLWARKNESKLTNVPVYYPGDEDLFLYLISHGARHGWFRLKWLYDIHRCADQLQRPDKLLRKNNFKNMILVGQALILAHQLFQTPLSANTMKQLKPGSYKLAHQALIYITSILVLTPLPEHIRTKHERYLFALNGTFSQKYLALLIVLFYPSPRDEALIKLPKYLHGLYFVLRPFLVVVRKLRKNKAFEGV
ncbi:nucleotidyltransferase family protein [Bacillus gobiensis]|uniref:nucleotidyltransferase domain-containing protein n=1 Tax=Bacillus gobiensis TaxID=1441095 RepID=UPI003D1DCADE